MVFCSNCGMEIDEGHNFCDNCGKEVHNNSFFLQNTLVKRVSTYVSLTMRKVKQTKKTSPLVIGGIILAVLLAVSAILAWQHLYESYKKTQSVILQTSKQLQETQAKLLDMASSTTQRLTTQEKELSKKDTQIQRLEADINSNTRQNPSGNISNLLSSLSSAVVKVVCASDAYGDNLQVGSGLLYYSPSNDPSAYFIETNLHVVETSDGSTSQCAVILYPNYRETDNYLVYKSSGYQIYKYGTDFAYIFPQIINTARAGNKNDLAKYAKSKNLTTYCKSVSIGDHLSVLGYPGVGGSSLTVTDGIISGFEDDNGVRYIKTSAKIEHGNSGGIAVKDSGCVLGIPTFVETGRAESIGRILDLNNLFQYP